MRVRVRYVIAGGLPVDVLFTESSFVGHGREPRLTQHFGQPAITIASRAPWTLAISFAAETPNASLTHMFDPLSHVRLVHQAIKGLPE